MDRLASMAVFVKAADLGSFSAAAESLNMSSQLVGRHISRLEDHLGVRLIHRTTRRQSLTDFGQSYIERCRQILQDVEIADGMAAAAKARPSGRLRVTAPISFGKHALARKLPDYMRMHSEVSVELSLHNKMVDLVDEGVDVAIRVGPLADSGLIARALAPQRYVLCAAPAYLQGAPTITTPGDLTKHACLSYAYTELRTHWTFDGPRGRNIIPITGRLVSDQGEPLLAAAVAGLGLILQPFELVEAALASGELIHVLPDYKVPERPVHILYAPDRAPTPKLRSFVDFCVDTFGSRA